MLNFDHTELIKIGTLVAAIVVVHGIFASKKRKRSPKSETVHVATLGELGELLTSGQRADGLIVDVHGTSSDPASEVLQPPIYPELVGFLAAAVVHLLFQMFKDLKDRSKREAETHASSPPVKLSGGVKRKAVHLLYEFELEHEGQTRRFRGAHAFEGKPYHGIEMVGKQVIVRYLSRDPSISMIEAGLVR